MMKEPGAIRRGSRGFPKWGSNPRTFWLRGPDAPDGVPAMLPNIVSHGDLPGNGALPLAPLPPTQTPLPVCSLVESWPSGP